MVIETLTDKT